MQLSLHQAGAEDPIAVQPDSQTWEANAALHRFMPRDIQVVGGPSLQYENSSEVLVILSVARSIITLRRVARLWELFKERKFAEVGGFTCGLDITCTLSAEQLFNNCFRTLNYFLLCFGSRAHHHDCFYLLFTLADTSWFRALVEMVS